jgi:hypothetical protein
MKNIKNLIYHLPLVVLILSSTVVKAQFTMSGEIRPRTEYLHGYKTLAVEDQDPAFWTEQRSRLNLKYSSDKYKVGLVLQDIRTWGSVKQLNKTDGLSSVHEAWAQIFFTQKVSLKLGRQELIYNDHRIFGNVGWTQQARSHDMAKFQYKDTSGATTVDVGLAYNQDATLTSGNIYTVPGSYKTFQYLWANHRFSKVFTASILFLNNGLQYSTEDTSGVKEYSVKFSQTAGTHLAYKKNKLTASGAFYFQTGQDGNNIDLSASDLRVEFMYKFAKKFLAGAGYERLSGTSQVDTDNKDNNSFTPFYGTNHKFNGYMDYFYVGNHKNNVGLQDIFFKLLYKHNKVAAGANVHLFSAAADVLDLEELANSGQRKAMSASLGTEIDVTMKYQFSKAVAFQAGYSHMLATETMEVIKNVPSGSKDETNNWAYLMITIKPVFIK